MQRGSWVVMGMLIEVVRVVMVRVRMRRWIRWEGWIEMGLLLLWNIMLKVICLLYESINQLNEIENISRLIHLSSINQIVIPFTLYNKLTSLINYTYKIYTFSNIKIQSKKNVPRKKPKPIKQKPSVPLSLIKSYSNNQLDLFGRHDPFQ